MVNLRTFFFFWGLVGLSGCHTSKLSTEVSPELLPANSNNPREALTNKNAVSVESLYSVADNHMKRKNYKAAASGFEKVQELHPYSYWATQAQIMEAYCRYQAHQYEDAIDLFTIFTKLHSHHKDAPYAHYMIGLSHYERIAMVERDQDDTLAALEAFRYILNVYPQSSFAKDAQLKVDFLQNHLAAKEMSVGRFYQRDKALLAAINRFRTVVIQYPRTEQRLEALGRLAVCYATLKMKDDFREVYEILKLNHVGSYWTQKVAQLYARTLSTPSFWVTAQPVAVSQEKEVKNALKMKKESFSSQKQESILQKQGDRLQKRKDRFPVPHNKNKPELQDLNEKAVEEKL